MTVIGQEANLVALGKNVTTIDNENPVMLELAEQVAALVASRRRSAEIAAKPVGHVDATDRQERPALLVGDEINPKWPSPAGLGQGYQCLRDTLQGLNKVAETRIRAKNWLNSTRPSSPYQAAIGGFSATCSRWSCPSRRVPASSVAARGC